MAEQYFLGIDNGGTGSKAVLYDPLGQEVAQAREHTEMLTPHPGFTERDMEVLWQVNLRIIRKTLARAGVNPAAIAGVSLTGHGKGLYLVGSDGHAVRPGIVSTDTRAYAHVKKWEKDGTAEKLFERNCQSVMACQPIALLKWMAEREPQSLQATKYIFGVKDFIRYRLTGQANAEITDMSGSGLINLYTQAYDPEIMRLLGLEAIADKLPPLVAPTQQCGCITAEVAALTGLREGTPVAAGLFDIDACAIAMGVVDESYIATIAGTWSINEYLTREPVMDHSVRMNSIYCLPPYYLAEESSPTSAGNLEWFIHTFLMELAEQEGVPLYSLADRALDMAPDAQSIIFLPYLYGGCDDDEAQAAFVGINASHTRWDMLRSVYECVVFGHRMQIERLLNSRPSPPRAIRLAGGVVNSPKWVQLFADVLQMPIETVHIGELGTLGAVMTAAVVTGHYATLADATVGMSHPGKTFLPNAAYAEIYDRKYQAFLEIDDALRPVWDAIPKQ